ncbi:MAG: histidine kinase [Pseudosphingobacterium sp.]|nr:histidine kinase [Pseudosphingobacterium sp.]
MKINIDKILPVVLAIFLPGLNLFSNAGLQDEYPLGFYKKWWYASLVLFVLWKFLEWVGQIKSKYRYLLMAISIAVFTTSVYLFFTLVVFKHNESVKWMLIVKLTSASSLILVIQYALQAGKNLMQLRLEKEQMQTENYKVQLEALRAKIDPHFLFNSLNTLRSMVRKQDINSEQFVLSLSDFYRQTLKYNESTTIKLYEEVKVLESYLFLMKNRNEEAVQVSIDIAKEHYEYQILTLALQTVLENCFKHNMMTSKQPLKIQIKSLPDYRIEISNNIQQKLSAPTTSGYGLENLKKRYELLGINNGLEVQQDEKEFIVKLKLS